MSRIVSFGEIMMRLGTENKKKLLQAEKLEVTYAGAEANVLIALSQYGHNASYVTRLPENDLGQSALNSLRRYGVDVSHILRGGPRMGIYFLENGASQRPSRVVYDRAGSSVALSTREMYNWKDILSGADWFHITGITPALGGEMQEITLDAMKTAKEMGIPVSLDINFRAKLWTLSEADAALKKLLPYVTLCINPAGMFGVDISSGIPQGAWYDEKACLFHARRLREEYGVSSVAISLRGTVNASINDWKCFLDDGKNASWSREYRMHIVDRLGGGDSFTAGLIHGMLSGWDSQKTVDFAAAASCLQHTIEGDFNLVSEEEIFALAGGDGSGKVQR